MVRLMKNDLSKKIMTELVGLGPKNYSCLIDAFGSDKKLRKQRIV